MPLCSSLGVGISGASWGENDTIVFCDRPDNIMRISAGGGFPESLVKKPDLGLPQILPDGKSLLFSVGLTSADPKIMVQPLKSGEPKELLPGYLYGYLPTGHIIYRPNIFGSVFAVLFDLNRLEVAGDPVQVIDNAGNLAISNSGTLVYTPPGSLFEKWARLSYRSDAATEKMFGRS